MAKINKEQLKLYIGSRIYSNGHGGITAGVLEVLSRYEGMLKASNAELRGKFSKKEWIAIADSMNGTMVEEYTRYSVPMFVAHCEDAEIYESCFTRHSIDVKEFCDKAKTLTSAQLVALYARVEELQRSDIDIDRWANY